MRKSVLVAISLLGSTALFSLAVPAAENFIPQGHSYAPDQPALPPLNSHQDLVNLGADMLQSRIDVSQRSAKLQDSEFNRFIYSQNMDEGSDTYRLDY